MARTIIENYRLNAKLPIDTRFTTTNATTRQAMDSDFLYSGLIVYQLDTKKYWRYDNGWELLVPEESGGGTGDISSITDYYIPYKLGNNLLTSAFRVSMLNGVINGTSLNTDEVNGTLNIGNGTSSGSLTIHNDLNGSYLSNNYNYIAGSFKSSNSSSSQIYLGNNNIIIRYKYNTEPSFRDVYTILNDEVTTNISKQTNKVNIIRNEITKGTKTISSLNLNIYEEFKFNDGTITNTATYDTSNRVTSYTTLYHKGADYLLTSNYGNFIMSTTYDIINGVIRNRFNNDVISETSRSGIKINGVGSEYPLVVSSTNSSRNIIEIKPSNASLTGNNTYGPGLIVNVNKAGISGTYIGQYWTSGATRITKVNNLSNNNYYMSFEQDDSIKMRIISTVSNDKIVGLNDDNTLGTKSLGLFLNGSGNDYLASASNKGLISNTQYELINEIPDIKDTIDNMVSSNGTVTSVGMTISGNALNVTGSPITTSGTFGVTWGGTTTQYVRGDGSLATYNNVTYTAGTGIDIINGVITNTSPNASQQLSISGNQLTITNGNTITLPTGTTYTAGTGIEINASNVISSPAQVLSLTGTTLTLSNGGGSITLPSGGGTYTAGSGLSLINNVFSQTIIPSGSGTFVSGITQTSNGFQFTLGTPPNNDTITMLGVNGSGYTSGNINITAGNNITVTKSGNNITISSTGGNGGVTSISAGNGMTFNTISSTGSITLGTPGTITAYTDNTVTSNSHTHKFAPGGSVEDYLDGTGSIVDRQQIRYYDQWGEPISQKSLHDGFRKQEDNIDSYTHPTLFNDWSTVFNGIDVVTYEPTNNKWHSLYDEPIPAGSSSSPDNNIMSKYFLGIIGIIDSLSGGEKRVITNGLIRFSNALSDNYMYQDFSNLIDSGHIYLVLRAHCEADYEVGYGFNYGRLEFKTMESITYDKFRSGDRNSGISPGKNFIYQLIIGMITGPNTIFINQREV